MKIKTINKVLEKEVGKWIESIKDEKLQKLVKNNVIITGGSIASMLLAEPVNDYDVYIADAKCLAALCAYYVGEFNNDEHQDRKTFLIRHDHTIPAGHFVDENGDGTFMPDNATSYGSSYEDRESGRWVDYFLRDLQDGDRIEIGIEDNVGASTNGSTQDEDKGLYRPVFMSSNAITLSDKFQIVVRFYGNIEEIHANFDFVHAMNYWTPQEGVVTNTRSLECLLARELIYSGSRYPLASIFRTRKFITRQWKCPISNFIKMAIQLNEYDLTDVFVLREQLTGVDALYCTALINAMQEKVNQDADFEFSADYICTLVEKIMESGDEDANGSN